MLNVTEESLIKIEKLFYFEIEFSLIVCAYQRLHIAYVDTSLFTLCCICTLIKHNCLSHSVIVSDRLRRYG